MLAAGTKAEADATKARATILVNCFAMVRGKRYWMLEKRFVRRGHLSHARFSSKFWPKILKLLFVYAPPTLQLKRFTTNPRAVSPRDRRLMERKTINHIM